MYWREVVVRVSQVQINEQKTQPVFHRLSLKISFVSETCLRELMPLHDAWWLVEIICMDRSTQLDRRLRPARV